MGRSSRPRFVVLGLALALLLSTIAVVLSGALAGASHLQPTVIEQHWELLGTTRSLTVGDTETVVRGSLPGGTTKFDPQPTVTLEVVGRVRQASAGTSWTVALEPSVTPDIASVSFGPSDLVPAIKTVSFTWPASDLDLSKISFTSSGSLPGTLDIYKAYLKIRQEGTIKKTVGRLPMTPKKTIINSTAWTDVGGFVYKHVAADFNPAPTITLRMGGKLPDDTSSLSVRLVSSSGSAVSGSQVTLSGSQSARSARSSSLSLVDGESYKVQASSGAPDPGSTEFATDLEFEQASSDAHGIPRTVGWYPSVTVTTEDPPSTFFKFKAPAKTTWGQGRRWLVDSCSVGLFDETVSVFRTTGSSTISPGLCERGATDSPAGDVLTSQPQGGNQTKLVMSVLRIVLELIDTTPPSVSGLAASLASFSPNADGVKDATTITANITDLSDPISWTLAIKNGGGSTVRSWSGSGSLGAYFSLPISQVWDGKDSGGAIVPEGQYTAVLTATDQAANSATSSTPLAVDLSPPTVSLSAPAAGSVLGGRVSIEGSATDAYSAVTKVEFYYRNLFSDGTSGSWHLLATDTTTPYGASWPSLTVADGTVELAVKATDDQGLASALSGIRQVEVRNGDLLGLQPFYSLQGWAPADVFRFAVNRYSGDLVVTLRRPGAGGGASGSGVPHLQLPEQVERHRRLRLDRGHGGPS